MARRAGRAPECSPAAGPAGGRPCHHEHKTQWAKPRPGTPGAGGAPWAWRRGNGQQIIQHIINTPAMLRHESRVSREPLHTVSFWPVEHTALGCLKSEGKEASFMGWGSSWARHLWLITGGSLIPFHLHRDVQDPSQVLLTMKSDTVQKGQAQRLAPACSE